MKDWDYEPHLSKLRRELRRLENAPASPIARRNGRARVLTAMRALRAALDKSYPPIIDRTGVKHLKTFAGRFARLKNAGWRRVSDSSVAGYYAAAGVRVKRLEHTDDGNEARGMPGVHHVAWLVPAWALAIGLDKARLRAAKKSLKLRNAALVSEALATP